MKLHKKNALWLALAIIMGIGTIALPWLLGRLAQHQFEAQIQTLTPHHLVPQGWEVGVTIQHYQRGIWQSNATLHMTLTPSKSDPLLQVPGASWTSFDIPLHIHHGPWLPGHVDQHVYRWGYGLVEASISLPMWLEAITRPFVHFQGPSARMIWQTRLSFLGQVHHWIEIPAFDLKSSWHKSHVHWQGAQGSWHPSDESPQLQAQLAGVQITSGSHQFTLKNLIFKKHHLQKEQQDITPWHAALHQLQYQGFGDFSFKLEDLQYETDVLYWGKQWHLTQNIALKACDANGYAMGPLDLQTIIRGADLKSIDQAIELLKSSFSWSMLQHRAFWQQLDKTFLALVQKPMALVIPRAELSLPEGAVTLSVKAIPYAFTASQHTPKSPSDLIKSFDLKTTMPLVVAQTMAVEIYARVLRKRLIANMSNKSIQSNHAIEDWPAFVTQAQKAVQEHIQTWIQAGMLDEKDGQLSVHLRYQQQQWLMNGIPWQNTAFTQQTSS